MMSSPIYAIFVEQPLSVMITSARGFAHLLQIVWSWIPENLRFLELHERVALTGWLLTGAGTLFPWMAYHMVWQDSSVRHGVYTDDFLWINIGIALTIFGLFRRVRARRLSTLLRGRGWLRLARMAIITGGALSGFLVLLNFLVPERICQAPGASRTLALYITVLSALVAAFASVAAALRTD